jgi:hypothetical protein
MDIKRLIVGKGHTTRHGDMEEWDKEYYEIEVVIEDPAELEVAKANLTGLIDGWLTQVTGPKPITQVPAEAKADAGLDPVQLFPEELKTLLSFERLEDHVIVKPRQFLGSDNFARIASIVRAADGEYISSGKASHFRVPIKSP